MSKAPLKNIWQVNVLTLFPEMFPGVLGYSIPENARKANIWNLSVTNIRDFAQDKHHTVDEAPYGGGAGMVMRADVVSAAIESVSTPGPIYYLSPRGKKFDQAMAEEIVKNPSITLICGRYEGIDERALEHHRVEFLSLGDFVLSGGEVAALAVLEACIRLLPGALGDETSLEEESFTGGLLEYPHYTRPQNWAGQTVPDVLLSGHHDKIKQWRKAKSEALTKTHRPDLWQTYKEKK